MSKQNSIQDETNQRDDLMNSVYFIAVYPIAILAHEFGHYWYFRHIGNHHVDIKFTWNSYRGHHFEVGTPSDYRSLDLNDLNRVYFSGVLFGLIPLFLYSLYHMIGFLWVPVYLYGCRKDLMNMARLK